MFYLSLARVGGFHILNIFHAEALGVIKLDASSREAGQDSGFRVRNLHDKHPSASQLHKENISF